MSFFGRYSDPRPITGPAPLRCTRKASSLLPHSADARPVAVCGTEKGDRYLCAGCVAALKAERYAGKRGQLIRGEGQLSFVVRLMAGVVHLPSYGERAARDWHAGREFTASGFARTIRREAARQVFFVLSDACPDCLRRGQCDESCALRFGAEFAEVRS